MATEPVITLDIAADILAIVDALFGSKDVESLTRLRSVLVQFILAGVWDEYASFIEVNEYIDECVVAVMNGSTDPIESMIRKQIDKGIPASRLNAKPVWKPTDS